MSEIQKRAIEGGIKKSIGKVGNIAVKELDPTAVLRDYFDYRRTVEENRTERERIIAKRDIAIQTIQSQEKLILMYFERRFSERKEALQNFFLLLTEAVTSKDDKQLEVALAGLLGIIKDNPLGDFKVFRENMLNSDYEIEI